jgi:hypothetical protein
MFIKWRTYQRQKSNQKGDKYYLQPILVKSVRPSKKEFKKFAESQGIGDAEFKDRWKNDKKHLNSPRHFQIYRFPSFHSCAYVYYDDPNYIEYRKHYWETLEIIFKNALSFLSENDKNKILDEIESILPKPYGNLLEILERAYDAGMPKDPSPKEYYESKKM